MEITKIENYHVQDKQNIFILIVGNFQAKGTFTYYVSIRGGEGVQNLTYAETNFWGRGGVFRQLMSAKAKNQNYDFLNFHINTD